MKIPVAPELNAIDLLKRAGYGQVRDYRASDPSWSRRLGSGVYPRFHAYINGATINLHLDQKQASYEGSSAHSGEYDGEAVEREADRIDAVAAQLLAERRTTAAPQNEDENRGFFSRIFGG